jgi:hypothetical protein
MLPTPSLLEPDVTTWVLRDIDGNVRAALICWGVALSAFVVLRIRREVLLGCLVVAGATVGLAATVVDIAPEPAPARPSAQEIVFMRAPTVVPPRAPAAGATTPERPY